MVAVARATYHDQVVLSGTIRDLPKCREMADLPGPVLVMIGKMCGQVHYGPDQGERRVATAPIGFRRWFERRLELPRLYPACINASVAAP